MERVSTPQSGPPVPLYFTVASLQNAMVEEAEKRKQLSVCLTVYSDTGLQMYHVPALRLPEKR